MGKAIRRKHLYNNDTTLNFLATFAARVSLIQGEWMRNNKAQALAWRNKRKLGEKEALRYLLDSPIAY